MRTHEIAIAPKRRQSKPGRSEVTTAFRRGRYAIHRAPGGRGDRRWKITHTPSGMCVARYRLKKDAIRVCRQLARLPEHPAPTWGRIGGEEEEEIRAALNSEAPAPEPAKIKAADLGTADLILLSYHRGAVGRAITCPTCGSILDMRRSVSVDLRPLCGRCADQMLTKHIPGQTWPAIDADHAIVDGRQIPAAAWSMAARLSAM